jgi:tetratricopeptide (TPR) repeat protein
LGTHRRWEEALREARIATELDPLSPAANVIRSLMLILTGSADEAIPYIRRALALSPSLQNGWYILATAYIYTDSLAAAAAAYDTMAMLGGYDPKVYRAYVAALSDSTRIAEAVAVLQSPDVYGTVDGSEYLAHLGQAEEALAVLERAYEERRPYLPWINAYPQYEGLRSDPRFRRFLARLNVE